MSWAFHAAENAARVSSVTALFKIFPRDVGSGELFNGRLKASRSSQQELIDPVLMIFASVNPGQGLNPRFNAFGIDG